MSNALVAGHHTIATDACAAHLMGHAPKSDWLTPPFHRDRNSLLCAAEADFGTVDLKEIDFESEVERPLNEYFSYITDAREMVVSWRRTTCEQALYYRDNRDRVLADYAGTYNDGLYLLAVHRKAPRRALVLRSHPLPSS